MGLSSDDLSLKLKIVPDMAAMKKAVEDFSKEMNKASKNSGADTAKSFGSQFQGTADSLKKAYAKGGLGGLLGSQAGGSALGAAAGALASGGGIGGAASAALGSALGSAGPMGAVIGAGLELKKMMIQLPFKAVAAGAQALSSSLQALQGPLGPIGAGLNYIKTGLEGIPLIGESLGKVVGSLSDSLASLVSMAAKASPSQFKQFQMALEDVQGVIGQTFLPVLNLMRDAVRFVGDMLKAILPSAEEMERIIAPLREAFNALKASLTELAPFLKEVVTGAIRGVTFVITNMVRAWNMLYQAMRPILELLGIARPGARLDNSQGSAARPAQIQGLEEYQRQLQIAAYSAAGVESPQVQQVDILRDIRLILRDIPAAIARAIVENLPGGQAVTQTNRWLEGVGQGAAAGFRGAFEG